jgi:hypothetical protein
MRIIFQIIQIFLGKDTADELRKRYIEYALIDQSWGHATNIDSPATFGVPRQTQ